MKYWSTQIQAVCPRSGKIKLFAGPFVPGRTMKEAETYCQHSGLGYCQVIGILHCEAPVIEYAQLN